LKTRRLAFAALAALAALPAAAALFSLLALPSAARAEGFALDRYEPNAAGEWFLSVPHPWYSRTRWFAGGLTLDYSHNPLLGGFYDNGFHKTTAIVEDQLVGHIDLAASFLDRVQVSLSLPVVLVEHGQTSFGVSPLQSGAVGDPRVGVMVRLWGQTDRALSLHLGGYLFIPVGSEDKHAGDATVRGLPQAIVAGLIRHHLRYSGVVGVYIRQQAQLGFGPAATAASEMQLAGAVAWTDREQRWQVGPEANFATDIAGPRVGKKYGTSLELLLGAQLHVAKLILVGVGVGSGVVSMIGTPDARVLLRVAYAPIRKPPKPRDSDGDGVADDIDACPNAAGPATMVRGTNGCPDSDRDGVPDAQDECPNAKPGSVPDPAHPGCPRDSDHDGIPDAEDQCPGEPAAGASDASRPGCPRDSDHDGVPDAQDACPNDAPGAHPDLARAGCPQLDSDHDGVPDAEDACPNDPPGAHADPKRAGCPVADADNDGVPDAEDACPKDPGVANADAKSNGCPQLSSLQPGDVLRLHSVHFETNKWTLLPESDPILDEVAKLLQDHKEIGEVIIEGHADDRGTAAWNLRLSRHRAQSVVDYLVKKGVRAGRLRAVGFGDTKPLDPERNDEARAKNRRVEVHIPDAKP
jgi:outer membrane protein OmpA-like peptidoglycan-associated protein